MQFFNRPTLVVLLTFLLCSCADIEDGVKAYEEGEYESAMDILIEHVDDGEPLAPYYVAKMYDYGKGVSVDNLKAFMGYRLAGERGRVRS